MSRIGKEYLKVENFGASKCLVVYEKHESLTSGGEVLVKHDNGLREWIPKDKFEKDYVEK